MSEATETKPVLDQPIEPDESAMVGQVISMAGRESVPLPNTEVRLADVFWNDDKSDGAFMVDESSSPTTFTDQDGFFFFENLKPRDYVLVVGDLYSKNVILAHPNGNAIIYTTKPGEKLDIGPIEVDLEAAPILVATPIQIYPAPIVTSTRDPDIYP